MIEYDGKRFALCKVPSENISIPLFEPTLSSKTLSGRYNEFLGKSCCDKICTPHFIKIIRERSESTSLGAKFLRSQGGGTKFFRVR